mmetsp:Transcript_35070/g.100170  ORF Transcript_35070/g.100170 Transcript_35070/m.100170 type:complete len:221 (-) Transcript_35070:190-852(-)
MQATSFFLPRAASWWHPAERRWRSGRWGGPGASYRPRPPRWRPRSEMCCDIPGCPPRSCWRRATPTALGPSECLSEPRAVSHSSSVSTTYLRLRRCPLLLWFSPHPPPAPRGRWACLGEPGSRARGLSRWSRVCRRRQAPKTARRCSATGPCRAASCCWWASPACPASSARPRNGMAEAGMVLAASSAAWWKWSGGARWARAPPRSARGFDSTAARCPPL